MSSHASLVLAAALVALTVAGVHARRRAALKLPRVSRRWRRELRVAATVARECGLAILDATARKLKLPAERVIMTVDRHANTSAASVPLALDLAMRDGRIKAGDLVVLEAMGGGFTWGACVLRL